jgi:heat shock protein HtpX
MNLKTTLLLSLVTGLFLAGGYLLGGQSGMVTGFVLSLVMNLGSYWFSDKIVLSMHGAKEAGSAQYREILSAVRELAAGAGIPAPRVYVYRDNVPNAFATGRNAANGVVALSTGIIGLMSPQELRGVIAHELAHIKNRDMLVSTIAATMAGAISMVAQLAYGFGGTMSSRDDEEGGNPLGAIVFMLLAPIAATIIHLAVSRTREYGADETGARIAGSPRGLASALGKLHQAISGRRTAYALSRDPMRQSFSHMYIFGLSGSAVASLFSTHPPVEERIRKLTSMSL